MNDTTIQHKKLSITKTESRVLNFLLMKANVEGDVDLGYATYASDPQLQKFSGKSQQQLQRALRHLESLSLLTSTHKPPFRGTPVLFSLTFPQFIQVQKLVGRAKRDLLAHYIHAYSRRHHNPITAAEMAITFRVRKRRVQRAMKTLVEQGVLRPTKVYTFGRRSRRFKKIPAYELTEGQKPITHYLTDDMQA